MSDQYLANSIQKNSSFWAISSVVVAILIAVAGWLIIAIGNQSNDVEACRISLIQYKSSIELMFAFNAGAPESKELSDSTRIGMIRDYNTVLATCPIRNEEDGYIPESNRAYFYDAREKFDCAVGASSEGCDASRLPLLDVKSNLQSALVGLLHVVDQREAAGILRKMQYAVTQGT
ncbi:MAG: hypothetical protein WA972_12725 [Rhodococcus qingshengii]